MGRHRPYRHTFRFRPPLFAGERVRESGTTRHAIGFAGPYPGQSAARGGRTGIGASNRRAAWPCRGQLQHAERGNLSGIPVPADDLAVVVDAYRGELIGSHLNAVDKLAQSEATLLDERQSSELREQFIAVLGHDLRNPLASIAAGVRMIRVKADPEAASEIAGLMQASVNRMSLLIDNILDFARGRLGGGLSLERTTKEPLQPMLEQIIAELQSGNVARNIEAKFDIRDPVNCDVQRIGQLFSNLLGNAIAHGMPDEPIRVRAATYGSSFELSVANSGDPIAPAAMEKLFQPFYRGQVRASLQGLGLGLFIASQIAKAHGGTLEVDSSTEETRFTFQMPT